MGFMFSGGLIYMISKDKMSVKEIGIVVIFIIVSISSIFLIVNPTFHISIG
jgi:hypothetical protein